MTIFQVIGCILAFIFFALTLFCVIHIAWFWDRFIDKNPEAPTFSEYCDWVYEWTFGLDEDD